MPRTRNSTIRFSTTGAQSQIVRSLIGLPIISSDGSRNVGMVKEVRIDAEVGVIIIGEIERPLGMGGDPVAILPDMIVIGAITSD